MNNKSLNYNLNFTKSLCFGGVSINTTNLQPCHEINSPFVNVEKFVQLQNPGQIKGLIDNHNKYASPQERIFLP